MRWCNMIINGLSISKLTKAEMESVYQVYERSIPVAFENEGIGHLKEDICEEIEHKKKMLNTSLYSIYSEIQFLIAKLEGTVIGAISYGPCGEIIRECTENQLDKVGELGSLYVLPHNQGQGVGRALIQELVRQLHKQGITQFCLDSGYKLAQKKWLRKFGEPYMVAKDYWGPGNDHMIWLCHVMDFIEK